jgi:hypothetical protein
VVCVTFDVVLNEGSHGPPAATCYTDVASCVPTEGCDEFVVISHVL